MFQVREEYSSELERTQKRVLQQEQLHQQMVTEMDKLRESLKKLGKDVPETKFIINGTKDDESDDDETTEIEVDVDDDVEVKMEPESDDEK